jgi:hypothetical protein
LAQLINQQLGISSSAASPLVRTLQTTLHTTLQSG